MLLFFDTETTGIPEWKTPSDDPCQPHIVQLAAALVDPDKLKIIRSMNVFVKPSDWSIPEEMADIHGVSDEWARRWGVPEEQVCYQFITMSEKSTMVVGHNVNFDKRIIRIATKRFMSPETQECWKNKDKFCTMFESKDILKLPSKTGKNKFPKLAEAYEFFTGEKYKESHDAYCDMLATIAVFKGIREHEECSDK